MTEEPTTAVTWKARGNSLYRQKNFEGAIGFYNTGLQIEPANTDILNNKAMALEKLGRIEEAQQCRDLIKTLLERRTEEMPAIPQEEISPSVSNESVAPMVSESVPGSKAIKFLGKIAGAVKQGSRKISYSILLHGHNSHIKKLIIAEFTQRELEKLCLLHKVGRPHPTRTNRYGESYPITPTRRHWANHVYDRFSHKFLMEFASSKGKLTRDIRELEESYKKERIKKYPEYEKDGTVPSEAIQNEEIITRLTGLIKDYQPIKSLKNELLYHTNLYTYLCEKIPEEVRFEEQKGSSRPDISVGNIAIEIKGPTDNQGLITIADKINRYSLHFDHLIVVLFEVEVLDRFYGEWYHGIMQQYGDQVTIIRK